MLLPNECSFLSHQRIHQHKSPYICPECGASCRSVHFQSHVTKNCLHYTRRVGYRSVNHDHILTLFICIQFVLLCSCVTFLKFQFRLFFFKSECSFLFLFQLAILRLHFTFKVPLKMSNLITVIIQSSLLHEVCLILTIPFNQKRYNLQLTLRGELI